MNITVFGLKNVIILTALLKYYHLQGVNLLKYVKINTLTFFLISGKSVEPILAHHQG